MKKLITTCALVMLVIFANNTVLAGEITFVASENELRGAEEKILDIKALAISHDFYQNGTQKNQNDIVRLIDKIIVEEVVKNVPVFLYGKNLNAKIISQLFLLYIVRETAQEKVDFFRRPNIFVAGVILSVQLQGSSQEAPTILMRPAQSETAPATEAEFRAYLEAFWQINKEELIKEGKYAVSK